MHVNKKRKRSSVPKPGAFSGLYSNQILGTVVEALDPKAGPLTRRTARRFFRGSPVNEHNRKEIFGAMGQALIELAILPELGTFLPLRVSSARVYGDSLEFAARRWDDFMSRIQSESSWNVDMSDAGACFLRLAAVDVAVRLFALNRIAGIESPVPGTPLWAEQNGIGKILRHQLAESGLTRDHLAARIEVSPTSVDNWLDGRNPPADRYVEPLARELAWGDEAVSGPLARELRRQFTLARLCDVLSCAVGRDQVISAVGAVSRLAGALFESAGPGVFPEREMTILGSRLFLMGSDAPAARGLLRALAAELSDEQLRAAVMDATVPWQLAFGKMLLGEGGPRKAAAGLAQDYVDVVDVSAREAVIALGESIMAELGEEVSSITPPDPASGILDHPLSFLDDSLSRRRRLVERFPDSPEAHYQLGSFLGMLGKNTGLRKLIDEGLFECRIASGLCPAWDGPAVERGIILTNFGDHNGALRELEQVGENLPELTPHWRFAMGYVLTMLGRFPEGLKQLEAVIGTRPSYSLAYSYAARCAFGMRDKVKGRKYAKQARRFGDSSAYDTWRAGVYDNRRNG